MPEFIVSFLKDHIKVYQSIFAGCNSNGNFQGVYSGPDESLHTKILREMFALTYNLTNFTGACVSPLYPNVIFAQLLLAECALELCEQGLVQLCVDLIETSDLLSRYLLYCSNKTE